MEVGDLRSFAASNMGLPKPQPQLPPTLTPDQLVLLYSSGLAAPSIKFVSLAMSYELRAHVFFLKLPHTKPALLAEACLAFSAIVPTASILTTQASVSQA